MLIYNKKCIIYFEEIETFYYCIGCLKFYKKKKSFNQIKKGTSFIDQLNWSAASGNSRMADYSDHQHRCIGYFNIELRLMELLRL